MMFKYMSVEINNYKQFKEKLDIALTSTADDMVRVGYLLAQARDTDILKESGYSGMGEFAKKEYGLTPDQTSRFISIAERFGDGQGRLQDQWQQFGYSKLSEMLSLPDAINEALSPEITRDEIRELKAEVKEEEKITPIEAAIEQAEVKAADPEVENEPLIKRFFREFFRGCPQDFVKAMLVDWKHAWQGEPKARETVLEALAPSGIGQLVTRIPGAGKYMLSFKGEETLPALIGIRDSSSTELSWTDVRHGFSDLIGNVPSDFDKEPEEEARMIWSEIYGEPFPEEEKEEKKTEKDKKVKIAPAQSKKKDSVQKPAKNGGKTEKADEKAEKMSEEPEIVSDQPITVTGSRAAGEAPTSGTAKISYDVSNFMNPPKKGFTQEDIDAMEKRINGQENEVPLPPAAREWKIEDSVKVVNRLALDLKDYAESMEKLEKNHNYMYVSDLLFNMAELWTNKIMPEMEELTRLLKQRWDAEDEFKEDEDVQEEE